MLQHFSVKTFNHRPNPLALLSNRELRGIGWKRTAILPAPYPPVARLSALLSSCRRGVAQMSHLPLLSSRNLYLKGWFSTERKQRHRPLSASMQLI